MRPSRIETSQLIPNPRLLVYCDPRLEWNACGKMQKTDQRHTSIKKFEGINDLVSEGESIVGPEISKNGHL